jgi:hypothetical protein
MEPYRATVVKLQVVLKVSVLGSYAINRALAALLALHELSSHFITLAVEQQHGQEHAKDDREDPHQGSRGASPLEPKSTHQHERDSQN